MAQVKERPNISTQPMLPLSSSLRPRVDLASTSRASTGRSFLRRARTSVMGGHDVGGDWRRSFGLVAFVKHTMEPEGIPSRGF